MAQASRITWERGGTSCNAFSEVFRCSWAWRSANNSPVFIFPHNYRGSYLTCSSLQSTRKSAAELIMSLFPTSLCVVGIPRHQRDLPLPARVSSLPPCHSLDHIHTFPMMWQSGPVAVKDQVPIAPLQLVGALPKCVLQAVTCWAVLTRVMLREQLEPWGAAPSPCLLPGPWQCLPELQGPPQPLSRACR